MLDLLLSVIIVFGLIVVLFLVAGIWTWVSLRNRRRQKEEPSPEDKRPD